MFLGTPGPSEGSLNEKRGGGGGGYRGWKVRMRHNVDTCSIMAPIKFLARPAVCL